MNPEEKFKTRLEEVLDEQFPKGLCRERGAALVLFSYAVIHFKQCSEIDVNKLNGRIKTLRRHNSELETALEKTNKTIGRLNPEIAKLKGKEKHYR